MAITALYNILTSLHGNRAGLDASDNFIVRGLKIQRATSTDQQFLHNDVEATTATGTTLSTYGHSNVGATAAITVSLPTNAAIGQHKTIRNNNTATVTVNSGATTIAFSASTTLQNMALAAIDTAVSLVRESATRWSVHGTYLSTAVSFSS